MKTTRVILFVVICCLLVQPLTPSAAQGGNAPNAPQSVPLAATELALVERLRNETAGHVRISYHAGTGRVRFIGTDPDHAMQVADKALAGVGSESVARAFLASYGALFGLRDQAKELTVLRARQAEGGRSFVRFQQVSSNVPVLGGELIVQVGRNQAVFSVSGEILPDPQVDTSPAFSSDAARERAIQLVARNYALPVDDLLTSEPALWIYNPVLLGAPGPRFTQLVWRMDVRSKSRPDIKVLVLVNAHRGNVVLHFNQLPTARDRRIYDNNNDPTAGLPGIGPVRTEGQAAVGLADVDRAYDYAGDVYDYYWNNHGRDSLDGAGMPLVVTVQYCPDAVDCPYPGAFWDADLQQVAFGQWYVVDDVLAHEMTHGVTSFESNLFYFMQSGAINESLSDIFGEFVDLTNGRGNDDPSVRWLQGEELLSGAVRDMSNPPAYSQPDRVTSALWACLDPMSPTGDNGGVHINSGVGNKAAYLLTDGGTFNGYTVASLGLLKVSKIFYRAQTSLLTSAADYNDLYDALIQACTDLIGSGDTTAADVLEVTHAVQATEMDLQPVSCGAPEAPICETGSVTEVFFDDLENPGLGRWITGTFTGPNIWYYPQPPEQTYATSGVTNMWGADEALVRDGYIAMTSPVLLPPNAYLHFRHAFDFDDSYDGGVVEYSTDGSTWLDAGALFTHYGYNGALLLSVNPLTGRQAFTGNTFGYISSRLDLSSLAGQNVRFRFRIGSDAYLDGWGWYIDDVRIYQCLTAEATETPTSTPTATSTSTPTPSATATSTNTATPTASPTSTSTPEPSATPTLTFTPEPSITPTSTSTPTLEPSATPTDTSTPGPSPTATATSTPEPSATATSTSTSVPSPTASLTPGSPYPGPGTKIVWLPLIMRPAQPTPTPTPSPLPTGCVEGIVNGGFETSDAWYIPYTHYPAAYSTAMARTGTRSMRMGIVDPLDNRYSFSDAGQVVSIPSGAFSVRLRFYLYTMSDEPPILVPAVLPPIGITLKELRESMAISDMQYLLVLDMSDTILDRLLWQRRNDRQWMFYEMDLTSYRGQTIKLQWGVQNDGYDGVTAMYMDDVSLEICFALTPTLTPSLTSTPTATLTPSLTPTPTATHTATPTPTVTWTPSPTCTPSSTPSPTYTPTASNTPTPTWTFTPTPTVTPTSPYCSEGIVNGSFETDAAWVIPYSHYPAQYSTALARTGLRSMRMGIVDPADNRYSFSDAAQTVTIPSSMVSAKLRFWLYTMSDEPPALALAAPPPIGMSLEEMRELQLISDMQYLLIMDAAGTVIDRPLWQRRNDRQWVLYEVDLIAYQGRTIGLQFGVQNDGYGGLTAMYMDDVSLELCTQPLPTATYTLTPQPSITVAPSATFTPGPSPTVTSAPPTPTVTNTPGVYPPPR